LTGFFEYYSTFYYEFIICPYFGTELCRASFKARALVDWDLRLTGAYPKAAEHFKVNFLLKKYGIPIKVGMFQTFLLNKVGDKLKILVYNCHEIF